jgi:hypothetical protein
MKINMETGNFVGFYLKIYLFFIFGLKKQENHDLQITCEFHNFNQSENKQYGCLNSNISPKKKANTKQTFITYFGRLFKHLLNKLPSNENYIRIM